MQLPTPIPKNRDQYTHLSVLRDMCNHHLTKHFDWQSYSSSVQSAAKVACSISNDRTTWPCPTKIRGRKPASRSLRKLVFQSTQLFFRLPLGSFAEDPSKSSLSMRWSPTSHQYSINTQPRQCSWASVVQDSYKNTAQSDSSISSADGLLSVADLDLWLMVRCISKSVILVRVSVDPWIDRKLVQR